jgi:FkbM family methyltransferase
MDCAPDIVAELHGIRIPAAPHLSPRTIAAIQRGLYERPEIEGTLVNLRPGDRVVELGSGAGIVSAIIARNVDDVQVRTFEGNPDLIDHIRKLHALNGLSDRVTVQNALVMAAPDPVPSTLFSVSTSFLGSRIAAADAAETDARTYRVETLSYEDLRRDFPHNVLVMDIEGGELDFLATADLSGIDFLIVELHPTIYGADKAAECIRRIEAAGLILDPASSDLQVKAFKTPARMQLGLDQSRVAWRAIPECLAFDPDTEWAEAIETVTDAVLVKSPGTGTGPITASVFDADQREVPGAISWHDATTRATISRHHPRPKRITDIAGTWVFGGPLDPLSPDALRQMLARLWCLPHLAGIAPRGVVFFPHGPATADRYAAFLAALLPRWAPGLDPLILSGPSRFETLIVPPQAVAAGPLRHGTADFRAFLRSRAAPAAQGGAGGRLCLHDGPGAPAMGAGSPLHTALTGAGYRVQDLARAPLPELLPRIETADTILVSGSAAEDLALYAAPRTAKIARLAATPGDHATDFAPLARLYGLDNAQDVPLQDGEDADDLLHRLAAHGFV